MAIDWHGWSTRTKVWESLVTTLEVFGGSSTLRDGPRDGWACEYIGCMKSLYKKQEKHVTGLKIPDWSKVIGGGPKMDGCGQ